MFKKFLCWIGKHNWGLISYDEWKNTRYNFIVYDKWFLQKTTWDIFNGIIKIKRSTEQDWCFLGIGIVLIILSMI